MYENTYFCNQLSTKCRWNSGATLTGFLTEGSEICESEKRSLFFRHDSAGWQQTPLLHPTPQVGRDWHVALLHIPRPLSRRLGARCTCSHTISHIRPCQP